MARKTEQEKRSFAKQSLERRTLPARRDALDDRGRRGKRNEISVVGFMILEDGSTVPFEDLTEEQREAWRANCCKRLSERMSDYFTNHPEEYARF